MDPKTLPRYARARQGKRAVYDTEAVHAVLDAGIVAHVGFIDEGRPMVMPMAYAREGSTLWIHGASKTRISLLDGVPGCVTVTRLDGLVLARSGFDHSVNYRAAVVHGTFRKVEGEEFERALDAILDHMLPGRSTEVRPMTEQERKATGVVALDIEHASAKIRAAPPAYGEADRALPIWSGVVPVTEAIGFGIRDGFTADAQPEPASVKAARKKFA